MFAAPLYNRVLGAVVAAGLLIAPASAHAATKPVKATIALGDKRKTTVQADSRSTKEKAKKAHSAQTAQCANTTLTPTASNLDLIASAILCLHNQVRAAAGLPLLKANVDLHKAAAGHSQDMVDEGFFDHTGPDGDTFVDRILAAGYAKPSDGWTLGENLAWGTGDLSTPAGVMNAWMASPEHKANILKRAYRDLGVGVRLGIPTDDSVGATITADFGVKS